MTALLDTSVLVAVFYGEHEHHAASIDLFPTLSARNGCNGCTAVHRLAEGGGFYDTLVVRCASRVDATALYTWKEKHFKRQGPEVSAIVRRP